MSTMAVPSPGVPDRRSRRRRAAIRWAHGRPGAVSERSRVLGRLVSAGGQAASEAACKPSSVPRKRGDGHPSRAPVTRHLMRPTRERGDAPLVRLTPHGLSYLALHQVELARFTRPRPKPPPTRLCGAGPRLTADGCYPLPCVAVLGLSSSGGSPRRAQPSGHLAGERTLAPAPRTTRGGGAPSAARRVRPHGTCRPQRWTTRWWEGRRCPGHRLSHPGGQTTAEGAVAAYLASGAVAGLKARRGRRVVQRQIGKGVSGAVGGAWLMRGLPAGETGQQSARLRVKGL